MNLATLQAKINRHKPDRAALLALSLVTPEMLAQAWHIWEVSAPRELRDMLIAGSGWRWDATVQGYRNRAGTLVSGRELKDLALKVSDALQKKMREDAMLMVIGGESLDDWHRRMEANVGGLFIVMAAIAAGGFGAAMAPSIAGAQGGSVRGKSGLAFSLERLEQFKNEMNDAGSKGRKEEGKRIADRSAMYGETANTVFEDVRVRSHEDQAKATDRKLYYLNVLDRADHCHDKEWTLGCPTVTKAGWQPVGALPRIGDRTCGFRCRCSWDFSLVGPDANLPSEN